MHALILLASLALLTPPLAAPPLAGPKVTGSQNTPLDQRDPTEPTTPAMSQPVSAQLPPEQLAARNLGHRAAAIRIRQQVISTVVLVENDASFADAVAAWTPLLRFPVLYDDGSPLAAAHISRFVRAFAPDSVVRWSSDNSWPDEREDRQRRILEAQAQAIGYTPKPGQPHNDALMDWLHSVSYDPTGIVIVDTKDTAWPAALALSAGRFQPVTFFKIGASETAGGGMLAARADHIDRILRNALEPLSIQWQGLGAGIDAITLVGRFPGKVKAADNDFRSLTDRIGKDTGEVLPAGTTTTDSPRWAWAGQIFGSEPAAAYTAMCSLFLETDSLWAFDAYDPGFGNGFEISKANDLFANAIGFETILHQTPNNGLEHWRAATSNGGIDAGLVMVNTHGNSPEFNFPDNTRGYAGDIPLLTRPAAVSFIHSFSMQTPDNLKTVGGRWLNHGAYFYIGSMNEPYLDAFVPPAVLAARFADGWAFGAAARSDHRGWWRISVHGDPLLTLGPAGTRTDSPLPLTGALPLEPAMKASLDEKDYAAAVKALVMLGRDHDAARLLNALLSGKRDEITPQLAAVGLGPLFRDKQFARVLDLWSFAAPGAIANPVLADPLWAAARMQLRTGSTQETISLLKNNLRPDQEASDAVEIAHWISTESGSSNAAAYLRPIELRLRSNGRSKNILNQAIRSHGG